MGCVPDGERAAAVESAAAQVASAANDELADELGAQDAAPAEPQQTNHHRRKSVERSASTSAVRPARPRLWAGLPAALSVAASVSPVAAPAVE